MIVYSAARFTVREVIGTQNPERATSLQERLTQLSQREFLVLLLRYPW